DASTGGPGHRAVTTGRAPPSIVRATIGRHTAITGPGTGHRAVTTGRAPPSIVRATIGRHTAITARSPAGAVVIMAREQPTGVSARSGPVIPTGVRGPIPEGTIALRVGTIARGITGLAPIAAFAGTMHRGGTI